MLWPWRELTQWLHLRWQDVKRWCQQIKHGSDTVIQILTVNTGSSSWIWQQSGFRVQTDKADENSFPLKPSCAYFILIWMLIFKWWNYDFSCRTRRIQAGTLLLAFTMLEGAMQVPGGGAVLPRYGPWVIKCQPASQDLPTRASAVWVVAANNCFLTGLKAHFTGVVYV